MLKRGGGKAPWLRLAWRYLRRPLFDPLQMTSDNKSLLCFNLSFLFNRHDMLQQAMQDLLQQSDSLIPSPLKLFPMEEIRKAHQYIESGRSVGKIVITTDTY